MTTVNSKAKSCINCPSYGSSMEGIAQFGKSFGAPVCLRYGKILGRPGAKPRAERKLAEVTAAGCPSYGKERPGTYERIEAVVAFPDVAAQDTTVVSDEDQKRCTTCTTCKNMVRETAVAEAAGWPIALCAAKGKLLLPTRYTQEARGCEFRAFGAPRSSMPDIKLLPEYDPNFGSTALDPVASYFKNKENFVDPTEYVSDGPVSDEDRARGVRAVRRVVDPNGYGEDLFLPVYDVDRYPEHLARLVPRTGDATSPELYVDHAGLTYDVAACWTMLDETPAFWGPAGIGKTEFFRYMAWLMVLPFHRLSITASTELDDLAGKMLFSSDKGTYFQYGRLPKAWGSPGVICIDEPNTGQPEVWQFLRPLTDNSKQLVLDMNEGEILDRDQDSFLGMAMNPSWDPKNIGALEIGDADANRLMHFALHLPPDKIEREIITSRVKRDGWEMPKEMLDVVMQIAVNIRALCDPENGTLPSLSWEIRPQIKVARALRFFAPIVAYRRAIGDSLDPQQREAILDQVRNQVDSDALPWR